MIKRALLALALMAAATVAQAAGTVPGFNLTPQFDSSGHVMPGCKLYVYQAGTVATPQNAYQDSALTLLQTNPLVCDASGRLPQWFVADGTIKLRLTSSSGTQVFSGDNLLVIGPSSGGGGGGGTVDPTTIAATGDLKAAYGTGTITGWVRMNGRTIGSATSGASERANSDVQALFTFLWNGDANLTVSTGRGASAAADFAANKTITLPDGRGRVLAGLDDMGNSAAGRLTATYFGATGGCSGALGTTLGAACGQQSHTLTAAQIPTLSGTTNGANTTTSFSYPGTAGTNGGGTVFSYIAQGAIQANRSNTFIVDVTTPIPSLTANINTSGSGNAHPTIMPTMLITNYIKL